jgi:hypothetical protein
LKNQPPSLFVFEKTKGKRAKLEELFECTIHPCDPEIVVVVQRWCQRVKQPVISFQLKKIPLKSNGRSSNK